MNPLAAPPQAIAGRPDCQLIDMGPPAGVSGDDVGTAQMLISPPSEEIPGYPAKRQYVYYRPSDSELRDLANGGFIEFCQYGNVVQPFSATVWAIDQSGAQNLRCYRCHHTFTADMNLIDTRCPKCASDSFVPVKYIQTP